MERYIDVNEIMINHIPNHIRRIKTVDMDIMLSVVMIYRGENDVHKFMTKMFEEAEWCKKMKYKHFNKDMILTKDDEQNFKNADKCYICNTKYSEKDVRVRDHLLGRD